MKRITILISVFLLGSLTTKAQDIIEKMIEVQDSEKGDARLIKIWLPEDQQSNPATQAIYVFDAAEWFDLVVANVKALYLDIPPTAVIGVYYTNLDDRSDVGYRETRQLDKYGREFYNHFTNDVRKAVNEHLPQNHYSIFYGHSYLADYGIWYLENRPEIFDAYLILAPEDEKLLPNLNSSHLKDKRIYIASGSKDLSSRVQYGQKLYALMEPLTNDISLIKNEVIDAEHNTLPAKATTNGLEFIYHNFVSVFESESFIDSSLTMSQNYEKLSNLNHLTYKANLDNNARLLLNLYYGSKKCNLSEYEQILTRFGDTTDPNFLEIIGGLYSRQDEYQTAITWLERAIRLYSSTNKPHCIQNATMELYKI